MKTSFSWQGKIGNQRNWIWRGWQIRYTFQPSLSKDKDLDIPFVLLHGFGASIPHWRKNIPVLSEKNTVYAIDLLGFGASKKAYTNYQIKLWGEQIHDFWQTFIQKPIILVGNSIGSLIALYVAANYPEIAKGLIMLTIPDVTLRQKKIPKPIQPFIRTLENVVASPVIIKAIFYFVRRPNFIKRALGLAYVDKNSVGDELIEIICHPTQDRGAARTLIAFTQSANEPEFSPSPSQLLTNLEIPILVIWGKSDRLIPFNYVSKLLLNNANLDLHLLDNIGHCPHDECPNQFHEIVFEWLANKF